MSRLALIYHWFLVLDLAQDLARTLEFSFYKNYKSRVFLKSSLWILGFRTKKLKKDLISDSTVCMSDTRISHEA